MNSLTETNPWQTEKASSWSGWGCLRQAAIIGSILLIIAACSTTKDQSASSMIEPPRLMTPPIQSPMPEAGPRQISQTPTGSLWVPTNGSLFQDIKAHRIGDILTITVSEESKASKAASTVASRDKNFAGEVNFAGATVGGATKLKDASFGPLQGSFSNGFNGSAQTSKEDSMSTYMSATVIDVLPNGNLFIRGSRWTKVNNEMQQIVLEGIVRPADINRNNSVLSQNIAEAKIFFVGKGPVSQQQKPGWLGQILDVVSPF